MTSDQMLSSGNRFSENPGIPLSGTRERGMNVQIDFLSSGVGAKCKQTFEFCRANKAS